MKEIETAMSTQLLIGEALKYAVHNVPNREAVIYEQERLTYRELFKRSKKIVNWLQEQGIGRDDKVGCLFKNGIPFVELYFGTSMNGSVFVPINFRLVSQEVAYILNNSDVKILFIEEEFSSVIEPIVNQLPQIIKIVVVGEVNTELAADVISYSSIFQTSASYNSPQNLSDDDAHVIIYTSGTTGRPKGAVLTHKNLYINAMNKLYHTKSERGTKHLIIPPLFHIAALSLLVQNCLMEGTIIIQREFQPIRLLETIENEKVNSMFLVPAMWNQLFEVPNLSNYDVSSMVNCSTGGAICPVDIKRKIISVFKNAKIHEAFGQTEMSPTTTYLSGEDSLILDKTDSVGKPSINVRVRIVDDHMNDVPVGEVGEIVYQGPTVMKEYYKNEKATNEAMKGGWFHSGDLVRMDNDGYIYIVDRKKDMIISGGENIYPKELEEVLFNHPAIFEAAVIGVPDPKWGETVKAFIVLKPNAQLTEQEVINYCSENLASYKKPRVIVFIESLPRNASGKVLKTVLREEKVY